MNKSRLRTVVGLLLLVALSACTLHARVPEPEQVSLPTATRPSALLPPANTPEAQETPTLDVQASPTSLPTATVEIIPDQPATIAAQGVNLRQGPGTLFSRLGMLDEGTKVTVTGKARGDDWLYIDTGHQQGWVSTALTSLFGSGQLATVPLQPIGDVLAIQGRVAQADGKPLAGIEFAAFQGGENSKGQDTRAHSTADGSFFLYLPHGSSGVYRVSLTGVDCKSPAVDDNCNIQGSFSPEFIDVTIPAERVIEFKYTK